MCVRRIEIRFCVFCVKIVFCVYCVVVVVAVICGMLLSLMFVCCCGCVMKLGSDSGLVPGQVCIRSGFGYVFV